MAAPAGRSSSRQGSYPTFHGSAQAADDSTVNRIDQTGQAFDGVAFVDHSGQKDRARLDQANVDGRQEAVFPLNEYFKQQCLESHKKRVAVEDQLTMRTTQSNKASRIAGDQTLSLAQMNGSPSSPGQPKEVNARDVSNHVLTDKDLKQQMLDTVDEHAFNQKTNDSQHFSEAVGTQQNQ